MIQVVIAKPTKDCNADCKYCSSPPDHQGGWSIEQFKTIFDRLSTNLADDALFIWHGGEPMLLGPEFYVKTAEYAKLIKPNIQFAMQTNLLLYKTRKWKSVFENVFDGQISSSFDPDEQNRTIKGKIEVYSKQFYKKIQEVMNDGFRPLVIGTYTEETAHFGMKMYEKSLSYGENAFSLRFNYRYPAGRVFGDGAAIKPETFGNMLIELYDRWIKELPSILITPLDDMFVKCIDTSISSCPWTRSCGGKYLSIEPNGDAYNCGEFADLQDPNHRYGNLLEGWIATKSSKQIVNFYKKPKSDGSFASELMVTEPAKLMSRRRFDLPQDCKTCRHFQECEGGCMRDAELFNRGLGGKFYYCKSWKMVFDRIKESIINGEADRVIAKMGFDVEESKRIVTSNAQQSGFIDRLSKSFSENF